MGSRDSSPGGRGPLSVARAVVAFALAGLVVLVLVGVGGVFVLRRIGTSEAYHQAEQVATIASRIVQRRLGNGIVRGSAESLLRLDELVNGGVLADPIVRIRLRATDGTILYYSDAPELIGTPGGALEQDEVEALETGEPATEQVDTSLPQNELERGYGPLLQVSLPIVTPDGTELLFQVSMRFESVAASGRELWSAFLPVLAAALVVLALLQIPLAFRLARRVRDAQRDRERLLGRAIEASELERRRIAADLHEGLVQQMAGVWVSFAAKADAVDETDREAAELLREGAATTRQGVRSLRSALLGLYPPSVRRAGLSAALSDLAAPLAADGVETDVRVPDGLTLPAEVEALLFRAAQEAFRNVRAHAGARTVRASVSNGDGTAVLEVEDDGVGFSDEATSTARAEGHLGLALLEDLARDAGATIDVSSTPGEGTRVRLEVPVP